MKKINESIRFIAIIAILFSCNKVENINPSSQKLDKPLILIEQANVAHSNCAPTKISCDNPFFGTITFDYDASGKMSGGLFNGLPFTNYFTGKNITKVIYGLPGEERNLTVTYDSQNRPIRAKKIFPGGTLEQNFVVTYNDINQIKTLQSVFSGDFSFVHLHRLVYNDSGNLTNHYITENEGTEYLWTTNIGFDNKKNINKGLNLNPLYLFYEPLNLFDFQSKNNQYYTKQSALNSDWVGTVNYESKNTFSSYSTTGFPLASKSEFKFEIVDLFAFEEIANFTYEYNCNGKKSGGRKKTANNSRKSANNFKANFMKYR